MEKTKKMISAGEIKVAEMIRGGEVKNGGCKGVMFGIRLTVMKERVKTLRV